jgi:hypothetical protein
MTLRIPEVAPTRIDPRAFAITDSRMPPRDPDDDEEDEDEEQDDEEDQTDEPPVVREPDEG